MNGHIKGVVSDKEALSKPVADFDLNNDDALELSQAIEKAMMVMLTTKDAIAVASNQIGYDKNFFVCRYDLTKYPMIKKDKLSSIKDWHEAIYINAKFTPNKGARSIDSTEGCLSHNKQHTVKRYTSITFTGLQLYVDDKRATVVPFECVLKGYSAAIAQHEIGHLEGRGIWTSPVAEEEAVSVS